MSNSKSIVLVDDHVLLRNALSSLVADLGYSVVYECDNGKQLMDWIKESNSPDLVLMDINMPGMDGFETTLWLKNNHPSINVIALSMFDDETSIIRMVKNGARGYILKDIKPPELRSAIESVLKDGFYYSDMVSGRLLHSIGNQRECDEVSQVLSLNKRELDFLKLACSELTYKEISRKMNLSPRTIDGYRDDLFRRLGVKSRVGLVLFVVKCRIFNFN
ncbi:MAG TPA: response regulator transcription factor [Cyclobacteriaceae bacterium]|nr:response regulator transcription factor [Cyclobacteriaceae bacterium]